VLITGEVKNPGTVNLDDTPKGVLDAIAAVGGLAGTASRRQVMLFRNGNAYRVNLAGLLSGSHLVTNPALQAGDVIHVPSQTIDQIFMLGQVSRSQPIVVQQNTMSLVEALTTVGGVDRVNAKGSGILVFRLPQDAFVASNRLPVERERPPASIFLFDLSRPEGMLLASEFQLLPRDVVYVDSTLLSKYNSIIASLLPTVNSLFYAAEINQLTRNNNY
jgi:polysaccharide export outer membrane protein